MRDYTWWLGRKRRTQKKYTLFLGRYMSPKEVKLWLKDFKARKKAWMGRKENQMRLIDADKLKAEVLSWENCYNGFSDTYDKAMIIDTIDEQPTIDKGIIKNRFWDILTLYVYAMV